jgi:hypothetical protein
LLFRKSPQNKKGLEKVISLLSRNWDCYVNDSTEGSAGGVYRNCLYSTGFSNLLTIFSCKKIRREKQKRKSKNTICPHGALFQMFDHLPLWVELKIDFSNQYLERIKSK